MTEPLEVFGHIAETTPVQLTRMEGLLGLISYKVDSLVTTVGRHETQISGLTLSVQRLGDEATSSQATVVATAKALREAKEAQEATSRAEVAKADQTWTPMARLFAFTTAAAAIIGTVAALYHG
jgi:hypothetical protein